MIGSCGFAEQVFNQQADAERASKGAQVFECGVRELDGTRRPRIVSLAKMDDKVAEWDVLGGFKRAFDFVHGINAASLFRVQDIYSGSAGAAHLAVGIKRGVHGEGLKRVGTEPLSQLGHMLAAGVVKVLAGGKDLDRLRAGTTGKLKQAWVQAMVQKEMSR